MDILMRLTRLSGQTLATTTRTIIVLFVWLNLLDFIVTAIFIQLGLGIEGNWIMANQSFLGMWLAKLSLVAIVILAVGDRAGIMRLLNIGMGLVVSWNVCWLILGVL